MDYHRYANTIRSTLTLDVSTPPFTIVSFALMNKQGTMGASIDANGNLVTPGGATITGAATIAGDLKQQTQVLSGDGAITIKSGTVLISKSSAAAITLAAPAAGTDDGKILTVMSTTAQSHTVTNSTPGFNNGGTGSDVGTFGAAIGNSFQCVAYNGVWYLVGTPKSVTFA